MHYRALIVLALVLAIVLLVPAAFAQTPTPPDSGAACAPATPCTDSPATTGLKLGSVAVETAAPAAEAAAETVNAGFGLAWAVMALLLLSLLYAIVAAVFATLGRELPALPEGSRVLIPILSVLGLGVALYLTYVETQNVAAVCGPVGDCNAVQASPFAKLFGFLPVGLLGALGYVGIIAAWFVARPGGAYSRIAALLMFGMALFGVLFTVYLTYLELFIIHAVCIWCLSSAVLMSLVLILSVGPALEVLQVEELELEEE
ncbi:MAG: vitamin K epoxide reductase family protein [Nitrososphaerales archaeon]